jgi:hypothetical protein
MRGEVSAGRVHTSPDPLLAVAAGRRPEFVLAVYRVSAVGDAQPRIVCGRADGHAAARYAVSEGHLLEEFGLAGGEDGYVGEPQMMVVVYEDDHPSLLEAAVGVHPEIYG